MANQFSFKTEKDGKLYIFVVSNIPSNVDGMDEKDAQEILSVDAKQKIAFDYLSSDPKHVQDFKKLFDERPLDAFEVFFQMISKQ